MLPGQAVPDLIRQGLGLAARAAGDWCDVFRPQGANTPMAAGNRIVRLPALFTQSRAPGNGEPLWQGIFDAAYTQPGDYLRGAEGVFFIAQQNRLAGPLCVKTNRVLRFQRPAGPQMAGMNRYVSTHEVLELLQDWPASVLPAGGVGRGALPGDAPGLQSSPSWAVLLPVLPVLLRPGDLARDDLGRAGVVASAALSDLGWRLHIKQAAS